MTDKTSCSCDLRKKIVINITAVLDEETCGISDSALVDVLDFNVAGSKGQPVLRIRYCPWCSKKVEVTERITETNAEEDETENWKQGCDSETFDDQEDDYSEGDWSGGECTT